MLTLQACVLTYIAGIQLVPSFRTVPQETIQSACAKSTTGKYTPMQVEKTARIWEKASTTAEHEYPSLQMNYSL